MADSVHMIGSNVLVYLCVDQLTLGRGIVMCCGRETMFTMAMVRSHILLNRTLY